MVLDRRLRSASWRRWWFCGSLRAQQHAKTEARGDRVMQLMLAAIADAVPAAQRGIAGEDEDMSSLADY
ncbi:2-oxoglutarate dehydrogenase, mitochondrial [Sesbania bispinosa]|nr:2-oxoglutarate dehydrogenase, mitochondrial [Sesbania bispinosa]